jgi:predicted metal-dependent enzyme (double-stranded beta helix superfamily)
MTTRTITPAIADLAAEITAIVRRDDLASIDTARLVADALRGTLGRPGLLLTEHMRSKAECYCQHPLYIDPEGGFSIVALVWMPGQGTVIHDHITWCVVGVYSGDEEETLYRLVENGVDQPHLVQSGHSVNGEGTTTYFTPPGDIHKVQNSSQNKVISLHVYGTDVSVTGTSVRRTYDIPVRAA